jgi:hypothetical protein
MSIESQKLLNHGLLGHWGQASSCVSPSFAQDAFPILMRQLCNLVVPESALSLPPTSPRGFPVEPLLPELSENLQPCPLGPRHPLLLLLV